MNDNVLFTSASKLHGTSTKILTSLSYRHADEVWSIQSILLVHQQLGAEDPLSGRFFFDWEDSGSAFAQFLIGMTRSSPVKVLKLTVTISSPCGTCDRTQEKLIFTGDDTATQSRAVNFAGTQQSPHRAQRAPHWYCISLPTQSCSHAEHSSSMTVFI